MPWKETCAVDERGLFMSEVLKEELSVAELCRRYGISRKTGHKWIERYETEGIMGLQDRSHIARHCPHRLSKAIREQVLNVRIAHPSWGPRKIRAYLEMRWPQRDWPAASTMGELFSSAGLTIARRKRRRVPASQPFGSCLSPNDVWTVDFKGWFRTGDGRRCDPLTLKDAQSRYLLRCQALDHPDGNSVWPIFDAAFREFGVPCRMRSDNGPPFASTAVGGLSQLSVSLIKAGVTPERIAPGKPQQNGRHERFHLTLKRETANPPAANLRAQQRRFDEFKKIYNEERPHEALGQTPPAQHYVCASRRYTGRLRQPDYADDFAVRKVRLNGEIKWKGELVFVSTVLTGEPVGIEEDEGQWIVHYGPITLGTIDTRRRRVRSSLAMAGPRGTHPHPPG
jgi:transposase InsO family protein